MNEDEQMENFKRGIEGMKKMVDCLGGEVSMKMKTNDGYIVFVSVREDDGSLDNEKESNKE